MSDKISPSHYKTLSGLEAFEVIESFNLCFATGTAVKYLLRAGKKENESEADDLQKAVWYINARLRQLSKSPTTSFSVNWPSVFAFVIALLFTTHTAHAAPKHQWLTSVLAMASADAADAATSWHQPETNPVLRSSTTASFGVRGAAIKAGALTAVVTAQWIMRKHVPLSKSTLANYAATSALATCAVHNEVAK